MAEARVKRRLAAILAADVVGYSRLMEEDEAGTLAALKEHHAALIDPAIAERDGRIEELKAAFHSQENNYWTHYGLAIVLAHSGNPSEAANILTTALKRWKVLSNTSDIEEACSSASESYRTFLVTGARLAGMPT